jgi:hypothetical protein
MFPHRKIHKYTWTSPVGNKHNQIDHVLIHRRWHSRTLDVRTFRGADCDTDHYLVVAKVRGRLAVSKRAAHSIDKERFNVKKLDKGDVNSIRLQSEKSLQPWKTQTTVGISARHRTILKRISKVWPKRA